MSDMLVLDSAVVCASGEGAKASPRGDSDARDGDANAMSLSMTSPRNGAERSEVTDESMGGAAAKAAESVRAAAMPQARLLSGAVIIGAGAGALAPSAPPPATG